MAIGTDVARLAYLAHLAAEDAAEQKWIRTLRAYYDGEHPTYLTSRMKEFIGLKSRDGEHLYQHNLCHLIVGEAVGRLRLLGFAPVELKAELLDEADVEQEYLTYVGEAKLAARLAMRWWDENKMAAGQDDLYEVVGRDGEAYVIVDWDGEKPRWTVNLAYDGTQGVKLHRDVNTGEPTFASKRWQLEDGRTRLTLYFRDRVEKYVSTQAGTGPYAEAGWEAWQDTPEESWPTPWPYGMLAVVPFVNPGGSDLGQVLPMQDALNKADIDLMAAQDMAGFPVFWASGAPADIDATTGEERTLTIGPGRLVRLTDPAARFGMAEPADLERLIAVSNYWVESVAGVSATPLYRLLSSGKTPPSGDSLEMQEGALVAKVRRKQVVFGDSWEAVVRLSVRLWNAFRPGEAMAETTLDVVWDDPRSMQQKVAEAEKKAALGVPEEQIWAELGYSQAQIMQFRQMRSERRSEEANLGEMLLRSYEQGEEVRGGGERVAEGEKSRTSSHSLERSPTLVRGGGNE